MAIVSEILYFQRYYFFAIFYFLTCNMILVTLKFKLKIDIYVFVKKVFVKK